LKVILARIKKEILNSFLENNYKKSAEDQTSVLYNKN